MDISLQKRSDTAKVRAKFLDTEHLSHIGLDMSQWRCKDLVKLNYYREPTIQMAVERFSSGLTESSERNSELEVDRISNSSLNWLRFRFSSQKPSQSKILPVEKKASKEKDEKRLTPIVTQSSLKKDSDNFYLSNKSKKTMNPNADKIVSSSKNKSYGLSFSTEFCRYDRDRETELASSNLNSNSYAIDPKPKLKSRFNTISTSSFGSLQSLNHGENREKIGWVSFIDLSATGPSNSVDFDELSKPHQSRFETCNFCGNQFGTAGFKIHSLRCPKDPRIDQITKNGKNNEERSSVSSNKGGRFQKSTHDSSIQDRKENVRTKGVNPGGKNAPGKYFQPQICDICNGKFGSQSISIHRAQCFKKRSFNKS